MHTGPCRDVLNATYSMAEFLGSRLVLAGGPVESSCWSIAMNWAKERDLLVAQTMSFVQSITGNKAQPAARETRIELAPLDQIGKIDCPVTIVQAAARPSPASRNELREEIRGRVAAFRAHQQIYDRERDVYFNAVLTKARASIRDPLSPPGN